MAIGAVFATGTETARIFCIASNAVGEQLADVQGEDFTALDGCALTSAQASDTTGNTVVTPTDPGAEPIAVADNTSPNIFISRSTYNDAQTFQPVLTGIAGATPRFVLTKRSEMDLVLFDDVIAMNSNEERPVFNLDQLNADAGAIHGRYGRYRLDVSGPTANYTVYFKNVETGIAMGEAGRPWEEDSTAGFSTNYGWIIENLFFDMVNTVNYGQTVQVFDGTTMEYLHRFDAGGIPLGVNSIDPIVLDQIILIPSNQAVSGGNYRWYAFNRSDFSYRSAIYELSLSAVGMGNMIYEPGGGAIRGHTIDQSSGVITKNTALLANPGTGSFPMGMAVQNNTLIATSRDNITPSSSRIYVVAPDLAGVEETYALPNNNFYFPYGLAISNQYVAMLNTNNGQDLVTFNRNTGAMLTHAVGFRNHGNAYSGIGISGNRVYASPQSGDTDGNHLEVFDINSGAQLSNLVVNMPATQGPYLTINLFNGGVFSDLNGNLYAHNASDIGHDVNINMSGSASTWRRITP